MLRAPHIKAFTNEKNVSEINNIVNVSYGSVSDQPYKELSVSKNSQGCYGESQDDSAGYNKTRDIEIEQNTKSEKILKLMLEAYKNNPLHINDYIVLTEEKLVELVMELTSAQKVELSISADIACCGPISKITYLEGIIVTKDDSAKDFKIGYNEEYRFLDSYRIATDFVVKAKM